MKNCCRSTLFVVSSLILASVLAAVGLGRPAALADPPHAGGDALTFPDPTGQFATVSATGPIDRRNPFFQSLGTNGRACVTCHEPQDAWSVTPKHLQARFDATGGRDPIFRTVDGSNSPNADVSTVQARRLAYSMLLHKGLIRIGIGIPTSAEFTLEAVDDPYGYASARELSLFRRSLPATNLPFLSTVMWDGRETISDDLETNLESQAFDAILGHEQADHAPTNAQLQDIVDFETGLFTAQTRDDLAGRLDAHGGLGGPEVLSVQDFYLGINDPLGLNPTGAPFDPVAFTLYDDWAQSSETRGTERNPHAEARQAVARGETLFNTRAFTITHVGGLNDALGEPTLTVTCTTCHDAPNVGDHSLKVPLNIGVADGSRRTPDLPLYTLRNNVTGELVQTTDPGRALISGKWQDIGKFKGPILRGLAARAPYFHNGSAATLEDAVNFYDDRFQIGFTRREKADLVAFLHSL